MVITLYSGGPVLCSWLADRLFCLRFSQISIPPGVLCIYVMYIKNAQPTLTSKCFKFQIVDRHMFAVLTLSSFMQISLFTGFTVLTAGIVSFIPHKLFRRRLKTVSSAPFNQDPCISQKYNPCFLYQNFIRSYRVNVQRSKLQEELYFKMYIDLTQ